MKKKTAIRIMMTANITRIMTKGAIQIAIDPIPDQGDSEMKDAAFKLPGQTLPVILQTV